MQKKSVENKLFFTSNKKCHIMFHLLVPWKKEVWNIIIKIINTTFVLNCFPPQIFSSLCPKEHVITLQLDFISICHFDASSNSKWLSESIIEFDWLSSEALVVVEWSYSASLQCDFCANLKFKKAVTTGQIFNNGTIWQKAIC